GSCGLVSRLLRVNGERREQGGYGRKEPGRTKGGIGGGHGKPPCWRTPHRLNPKLSNASCRFYFSRCESIRCFRRQTPACHRHPAQRITPVAPPFCGGSLAP